MSISTLNPTRDYFERIAARELHIDPLACGAFRIPLRFHPDDRADDLPITPHHETTHLLALPPPGAPEWVNVELALWKLAERCHIKTTEASRVTLKDGSAAILYELRGHHIHNETKHLPNTAARLNGWNGRPTLELDSLARVGRVLAGNSVYPRFTAVDYFAYVVFACLTGNCDLDVADFNLKFQKHHLGFFPEGGFSFCPRKVLDPEETEEFDMLMPLTSNSDGSLAESLRALANELLLTPAQCERQIDNLSKATQHGLESAAKWAKVPELLIEKLKYHLSLQIDRLKIQSRTGA